MRTSVEESAEKVIDWVRNANPRRLTGTDVIATFPVPDADVLRIIFTEATRHLECEQTVVDVVSPVVVVGDIHGHIGDLIRILNMGWDKTHVLLGDYVDRGCFSLEVMIILVVLKWYAPEKFILIRGNHEFEDVNSEGSFRGEVRKVYKNEDVYDGFMKVFSVLPLGALVDGQWLCVHGGLGLCDMSIPALKALKRPIDDWSDPVVASLVWSDPRDDCPSFKPSPRGVGFLFGERVVNAYLEGNKLLGIIRAHEVVPEGVATHFEGKVTTVFSASNYCGRFATRSGMVCIDGDHVTHESFPPLRFLLRRVRATTIPGSSAERVNDGSKNLRLDDKSKTPNARTMTVMEMRRRQLQCLATVRGKSKLRARKGLQIDRSFSASPHRGPTLPTE